MTVGSGILQRTSVEVPLFIGENIYSSQQMVPPGQPITEMVTLLRLIPGEGLCGENVCIEAATPVRLETACPIFQSGSRVTTTCFDRRFAYHQLDGFINFLKQNVKFDVNLVYSRIHHMPGRQIPVRINEKDMENAFFDPDSGFLTFGDGKGKWHFASDGDILVHEASHLIVHLINPSLSESNDGAGSAIHEGVADALAAIRFNDPEIAEDFGILQSGVPTKVGLRTVANNARFQDLSTAEPHEVGKVYSRFFWSLYQRILTKLKEENPKTPARQLTVLINIAQTLTTQIILAHLGNYNVSNPMHSDFVDAVKTAVGRLQRYNLLSIARIHKIDTDFLLGVVDEESSHCGFDWVTKRIEEEEDQKIPIADATLGEPTEILDISGQKRLAKKQFYRSGKHGNVLMLGQSYITPFDDGNICEESTRGLRHVKPNEIDEQVSVTQDAALIAAQGVLEGWQPRQFGPNMRQRLISAAKIALRRNQATIRLAIPFKAPSFAWYIKAGPLEITIDAKTGKLATPIRTKWKID